MTALFENSMTTSFRALRRANDTLSGRSRSGRDGIVSSEKCSKCSRENFNRHSGDHQRFKERDGDPLLETLRDLCVGWDGVQGFKVELEEFSVVDETVLDRLPSIVVDNVVLTREASQAVKHSGGAKIKADILVLKDHLQFSIVDDGNGESAEFALSGTLNMKARMASLGGHLEMHSTSSGVRVGALPFSIEMI